MESGGGGDRARLVAGLRAKDLSRAGSFDLSAVDTYESADDLPYPRKKGQGQPPTLNLRSQEDDGFVVGCVYKPSAEQRIASSAEGSEKDWTWHG